MASSHSVLFNPVRHETVYGVSIFDDLHNYIPEILYDTELFSSSPILMFIQRRVQTLFESEYIQNRTQYRMFQQAQRRSTSGILTSARNLFTTAPVQAQAPVHAQNSSVTPVTTYVDTIMRTPPRIQRHTPIRTQTAFLDSSQLGSGLSALLLSAITGSDTTLNTEDLLQQFINPVAVAPTEEQLHRATFLTVIQPSAEIVCPICQDHSSDDNTTGEWRYIRHCDHAFHRSCIDHWFQEHVRCPVCRFDIRQH